MDFERTYNKNCVHIYTYKYTHSYTDCKRPATPIRTLPRVLYILSPLLGEQREYYVQVASQLTDMDQPEDIPRYTGHQIRSELEPPP